MRFSTFVAPLSLLLGFTQPFASNTQASERAAASVLAENPYVRLPLGDNSALFVTLRNQGKEGHAIVAAKSAVADAVELHTHINDQGMMRMRPIERIELPAGQITELKPGGLHIMLIGLKRAFHEKEKVSVTLVFEDKTEKTITGAVRKIDGMRHSGAHSSP